MRRTPIKTCGSEGVGKPLLHKKQRALHDFHFFWFSCSCTKTIFFDHPDAQGGCPCISRVFHIRLPYNNNGWHPGYPCMSPLFHPGHICISRLFHHVFHVYFTYVCRIVTAVDILVTLVFHFYFKYIMTIRYYRVAITIVLVFQELVLPCCYYDDHQGGGRTGNSVDSIGWYSHV